MLENILCLSRTTLFIAVASMYACGGDSSNSKTSTPCISDMDCKGERICVEGTCEDGAGIVNSKSDCDNWCEYFIRECCDTQECANYVQNNGYKKCVGLCSEKSFSSEYVKCVINSNLCLEKDYDPICKK